VASQLYVYDAGGSLTGVTNDDAELATEHAVAVTSAPASGRRRRTNPAQNQRPESFALPSMGVTGRGLAKAWGRSFAPPGAGLRMTLPSMGRWAG
jgi:hypothetical protein